MGSSKPKPIAESFVLLPIQLGIAGYGLTMTTTAAPSSSTTNNLNSSSCPNVGSGTILGRKRQRCMSSDSGYNCERRMSPSLKRKCQFHIFSTLVSCFILGSFLNCPVGASTGNKILCDHFGNPGDGEMTTAKECESLTSNFCYALWEVNNNTGEVIFIKQGCWEPSPVRVCLNHECIATKQIRDKGLVPKTSHFCCCSTDVCNSNVTAVEILDDEEDLDPNRDHFEGIYPAEMNSSPDSLQTSIAALIAVITGICVALVIFIGVFITWKNKADKHKPSNVDDLESGEKLMEPLFTNENTWEITDPMVLGEEIAKGKFATVCSGKMGGMEVALKVFSADQREFFENEKFIFHCLGKTTSLSYIIKYHGWQEFSVNSSPSLIIALDRVRPGNLRDFLASSEANTMPLSGVMKLMRGICSGLAYLHGENKDEIVIAHRDLTSKNILVDVDLNCYVSDFGLSLLTKGSKYYWSGKERQAEFCSLAEAGTLRYMAPELLEGAVNLKDCENALKQADVYALALILWEVANLSHDIALAPICHRLPYEQELGKDICIETLARYVVTRRDRPSFSGWKDSSVTRSIRDTLNESWDPEPDARLTALCIVERLADLHHSKNNVGDSTTPLEAPPTSPWAGRNPCLERNLLEENSEDKSMEYLVTSEKHLIPNRPPTINSRLMQFIPGGGGGMSVSSSSDQSFSGAATTNTDLSSSSAQTHPLHLPVPPNPIPFVQNIRR